MKRLFIQVVGATLVFLMSHPDVYASGIEVVGFGGRAIAMGGAYAAIGEGYPAIYHNPAGLGFSKDRTLGLGYHYSEPQFKDVGGNIDIPLIRGIFAGFSTPLGEGKISRIISVGLGIYDPTSYVIRVRSVNPQRPNYIMYENKANRLSVLAGVSFRPLDVLSFGVGAEVIGGLTVRITLDPTNTVEPLLVDSPLPTVASPIIGVMFRPLPFISLAAVYRHNIDVPIELPTEIMLFGNQVARVKSKFQDFYRPKELSLGAAYFYKKILTASAEVVWHRYSEYVPPVPQIVEVEPESLKDVALASLNLPENVDPGFHDIWEFRLGVEGWPLHYLGLRVGYVLRPTPVPEQTGSSNYLDSTVHKICFGTSARFKDPFGILEKPVSIDTFFRVDIMTERTYTKTSMMNGQQITFSGRLYTVGLDLTYRF